MTTTYTTDAMATPQYCPCCEHRPAPEPCVNEHIVNADGTATVCGIPIAATIADEDDAMDTIAESMACTTTSTCEVCQP